MQSLYALQIFGPFRLHIGDTPPSRFSSERGQALLTYLLLSPQQTHTRIGLAELLWPEQPEKRSRQSLRQVLTRIRTDLGVGVAADSATNARPDPFKGDYKTLEIERTCFSVDALRFQALLQSCAEHRHSAVERCHSCAELLAQAVALYQGELLAGLSVEESPAFDAWLLAQRERLQRQAVDALQTLIAYHRALQNHPRMYELAEQLIGLDPYEESAHVHLIEALALMGERTAALAHYTRCEAMLSDELGAAPGEALQQIRAQLIQHTERNALTHALHAKMPTPGEAFHFPRFLTPFFGREAENAQIVDRLADPQCRLLTVTGPGGIGKSRLIVEAAQQVNPLDYPDGRYFVPLAALTQPEEVIHAIADALSIPLDERSKSQSQLLRALAKQRLLLVLDNFEQLMEAVPLVLDLLSAAPRVTCLVSSRHSLQIAAERQLPLGGLTYPAEDHALPAHRRTSALLEQYSAVAFFVERAQHTDPMFAPSAEDWLAIVRICRLVEGMPLAITLAASWLSIYDCAAIADQISRSLDLFTASFRDLPARHQNLRSTFEVSWQLLSPSAQAALARLSVFVGGFTRQAAQRVGQVSSADLAFLVSHALVTRVSTERFVLHELLRQFAAEKLEKSGDAVTVRRAHSRYFLEVWAAEESSLLGKEQHQAIARLREDAANLGAAWSAASRQRDWGPVQESMTAFEHYWSVTGMHAEGRRLAAMTEEHLVADLARPADVAQSGEDSLSLVEKRTLLARLQLLQGILLRSHAPISETLTVLQSALTTAANLPESASDLVGQIHLNLCTNYNYQGRIAEWEHHLDQAYQRLKHSTDYALQARLYVELSVQAGHRGDMPARIDLLKLAVRLAEQSGDLALDAYARGFLVFIQTRWGDFADILHHIGVIQRNARLVKSVLAEARALNFYAGYYFQVGDFEQMARYNAQALPLFEQIGDPVHLGILYSRKALHALWIADFPQAIAHALHAVQSGLTNQHMNVESIALIVLGRAYVQSGDLALAWESYARVRQVSSAQGRGQEDLQAVLGQATIRLAHGDIAAAHYLLGPKVPAILNADLSGLIDYEHIYADAYRILRAADDPRAGEVLARAQAILNRIAATIPNEVHRRSYWQNNPARRFVKGEIGD